MPKRRYLRFLQQCFVHQPGLLLVGCAFGGIDALTNPGSTSELLQFAAFSLASARVAAAGALAVSQQA